MRRLETCTLLALRELTEIAERTFKALPSTEEMQTKDQGRQASQPVVPRYDRAVTQPGELRVVSVGEI